MPFALNLIYFATLLVFAPVLVYRMVRSGKYREGLWEKFWGDAPLRIGDRPCLWFHAVSVGEVLLLRPLVREMARRRPDWEVVISTTTPTGLAVARRTFPDLITFYAPLDFSWATRRAMARIRPDRAGPGRARALAEPDPGREAVRGQGGDHQRPAQRPELPRLPKPARAAADRRCGCIDVVAAQDADYARRFVELGVPERSGQRHRLGQVRRPGERPEQRQDPRAAQGAGLSPRPTWSSWPAARWKAKRPPRWRPTGRRGCSIRGLRLILVPRHAERFDDVAALARAERRDGAAAEPGRQGDPRPGPAARRRSS